jgi:PKD repeat protein
MRHLTLSLLLLIAFSVLGQTPTIPTSNSNFSFVGCNEFTLTWTNGNGIGRVAFVKQGTPLTALPKNGEFYVANSVFGKGKSINNEAYCIFNDTGNSAKVTGLKSNTRYYVSIYEYNGFYEFLYFPKTINDTITGNFVFPAGLIYDSLGQSKTSQCLLGNYFKFKNKSYSSSAPLSFIWNFGDGDTSNLEEPEHSYKTAGIHTVTLTANVPTCNSSIVFNDTVYPHPIARFELENSIPYNDSIQCFYRNRFTFKNKTTLLDIGNGTSSMRYEWYEVPSSVPFSDGYKADYKSKTDGPKTIKLVAVSNRGCRDSTFRYYKIKPSAMDLSKVSVSPDSMPLKNNKFTFSNNTNKIWQVRSKNNPSFKDSIRGMSVNYSFKAVGRYYISFDTTDTQTGCYDKYLDSVEVTKDLGALSNTISETISIYPNPSHSGVFHINYIPVNASLKVFTIIGEELLTLNPREVNSEINLTHFGAGTYILSLWSECRKFDYRLVVL